MNKYCINCGSELFPNAKFCVKCGAPVTIPEPTTPVVEKKIQETVEKAIEKPAERPVEKSVQKHIEKPSQKPVEKPEKKVSFSAQEDISFPKKKKNNRLLCGLLSILLIFQSAAVLLYGWPGFAIDKKRDIALVGDSAYGENSRGLSNITMTAKDYKVDPTLVNVGPDNSLVKAGDMVIDFGEFNLNEEGSLEIRDMGVKRDEENGLSAHCYDFSLGDIKDFSTYVTITLPYEKVENPSERLFVQYYNESTESWELMYSTLNEAEGTITFYTNHFSTFAVFDLFLYEDGFNSGPLAKVHFNPLKLDALINNCQVDNEAFFAMMKEKSPEDSGLVNIALDSFGLTSNLVSGVDYPVNFASTVSSTLTHSAEWPFASELGKVFGKVGAGLTAVKVGLSWYDSGSISEAFKKNKYDIAELGLSSAAGALGATPLTVAAGGVWLMGMVDDEIRSLQNKGYSSPAEHAYQLFTWDYVSYSKIANEFGCILPASMPARAYIDEMKDGVLVNNSNTWAWLLQVEVVKNRDNPQKLLESIDKVIDDYASTFWKLKPSVRKMIAEDVHRADPWIEPDSKEIIELKEDLKAVLRYRLRKFFERIYERLILDAKQRLLWDIIDLEKKMNVVTSIRIFTVDEDGKEIPLSETEYKDYIAAFSISPDDKPTIWTWNPGSEGKEEFKCTLYNYLSIGGPTYIKLYKTWEDQVADKAALTLQFTYNTSEVKLIIGEKKVPEEDASDKKNTIFNVDELYEGSVLGEDVNEIIEYAFDSAGVISVSSDKKGNASFAIPSFTKVENSTMGDRKLWDHDISCGSMTFNGTFDTKTGIGEFSSSGTQITVSFYRYQDNNSSTTIYTVTNIKATIAFNDYRGHHLKYEFEGTDSNGNVFTGSNTVDLIAN